MILGSLENDLASFITAYFIVDYFAESETAMYVILLRMREILDIVYWWKKVWQERVQYRETAWRV